MSIYKKILELQKELKIIKRDGSANGYKYTTADQLFAIVRPKMDLLGLLLFQEIVEAKSEHVNWKTKYGEKQQTYSSATFKFTWVDVDTAETLVHQFHADGFNDWDKAIGSAMTYAERYYILKQFHIPTSELDPDARKENSVQTIPPVIKDDKEPTSTKEQLDEIARLAKLKGSVLANISKSYKVPYISNLTFAMAKDCIEKLKLKENI
jgi:hypothetical protein